MDFDLRYKDEPLTIRAEIKKDAVVLIDGEDKTEFSYFPLDHATYLITANGKNYRLVAVKDAETVYISTPGGDFTFDLAPAGDSETFAGEHGPHGDRSKVFPSMPGKVVKVLVQQGQTVRQKEKLVIVEAMKMENPLVAPYAAKVVKVYCAEGQLVDTEDVLVELKEIKQMETSPKI